MRARFEMKKILSVLILGLSASFAAADVEPIRFAPTRPAAAPVEASPAATPNAAAKPAKDAKGKKHTKAHHKKKATAPVQH